MAVVLLLNHAHKQVRQQDIGRTILQCLHGLHSIETALSVFHSITSELYSDIQPSSDVVGAFDAHVGDCACHMRAQMLWEVISHFRTSKNAFFLEQAITLLNELKAKAALLLQRIGKMNGNARALGLGSKTTVSDILQHIGFGEFLALVQMARNTKGMSASEEHLPSDAGHSCEDGRITPADTLHPNGRNAAYSTPAQTPASSRGHRSLNINVEWDPEDYLTVIRFLTFSRLLSNSKKATLDPGPPSRVIARVDPQYSYAQSEKELDRLNLIQDVSLSKIIRPGDRAKKNSLVNECETMQVFISQLTTDWTKKLAGDVGLNSVSQRLGDGLAATNARQISCVASYISILLIRGVWLRMGTPILIVIQRFCSHGYHIIFHRVTRNLKVWKSPLKQNLDAMGESDWFDITPVSHEEVISARWAGQPHVILVCVSGHRGTEEFFSRLVDANQDKLGSNQPHENDACNEADEYVSSVSKINFSHLIMHFFAQHEQFPFSLPSKQDGYQYVAAWLEAQIGKESSKLFMKAGREAYGFGTGRSIRLYSPQHVYLELPGVVGRQIKGMIGRKEKPGIIGYRWA